MKTAKDKHVVVGADFAGYPLKEAVRKHLIQRGWTVEDLTPILEETPMYHRAGFMVGARIGPSIRIAGLASRNIPTINNRILIKSNNIYVLSVMENTRLPSFIGKPDMVTIPPNTVAVPTTKRMAADETPVR